MILQRFANKPRERGELLLQWRGKISVREKGPADLVTQADLASQDAIRSVLLSAFPDHEFLGEEDASSGGQAPAPIPTPETPGAATYRWIVDPLDGTTNYVHGMDHFCVSVALQHGAEILAATVWDPVRDECFTGSLGEGAYLNGVRLASSRVRRLSEALVAASFAPHVAPGSPEVARFLQVLHRCQSIRRLGSAALNLCYVAAGRLDGYWASSIKTWDVAAGALLIREAGGVISSLEGGEFCLERPALAAAAGRSLHDELLAALLLERGPSG